MVATIPEAKKIIRPPYAHHSPMLPHPYRLLNIKQETPDTWTMEIEPADGSPCPRYLPGQFNMLYLLGVGEVPISISGDPSWRETCTHTVRAVGQITEAICRLKPGDWLGVRGPFGAPWPHEEWRGKDVLILAGGLGLAPLRPSIYTILTHRDDYESVSLLVGARGPQHLLYTDELERWRHRFDIQLGVTVDSADLSWPGSVGLITSLIPRARFNVNNVVAAVCGPEVMMRATVAELVRRGVPESSIFLSMERNMKCGIGHCGHCQFGPHFVCKDGPVFRYDQVKGIFTTREV